MSVFESYMSGQKGRARDEMRNLLSAYSEEGMFDSASPLAAYGDLKGAFSAVESSGRYDAVGPETGNGRAYGKYQVMDYNIGPWTEAILGQRMTTEEFVSSPEAQDAVFEAKMQEYTQRYGTVEDAASMWFSGKPYEGNNRSDGYLTVPEYVARVMEGL